MGKVFLIMAMLAATTGAVTGVISSAIDATVYGDKLQRVLGWATLAVLAGVVLFVSALVVV